MAAIVLCEPINLYNLLNQRVTVSRLAEINYLCLIDARETQDYNVSHIITAKHGKTNTKGGFLPLENVEMDTMQNIVVYDSKTNCLNNKGRANQCAKMVAKSSLCIVQILSGGFQSFSALYPFLRTEKIAYTIKELENLRTYPVEIIPGKLYMGNEEQANSSTTMEPLKIEAVVGLSAHHTSVWNKDVLKLEVGTEADKKIFSFVKICNFIDSQISNGSRVLLVSRHGARRCSVAATAYVMLQHKCCFQEAWSYVKSCKPSVIFDKRFTEQLSDWEKKV
ncbi:serine/threonine/tyrosine-interacting-like protein 1 [Eucyclogobius newberryi]|uniref:serine/threonine/tyrosine-interacting-like protein 1 n=1 Tax=Eucyclogobius newberryi TaxID=166745 RepID=UPI003B5CF6B2